MEPQGQPAPARILFDTNVLLDVLLQREPYLVEAGRLWGGAEQGRFVGIVGATSVTTLAYFIERAYSAAQVAEDVERVLRIFEVAPVRRRELEAALAALRRGTFSDYEDAVLHAAAEHARADALVTRNAADFGGASLPVYSPAELLAVLAAADTSHS